MYAPERVNAKKKEKKGFPIIAIKFNYSINEITPLFPH